MNDKQWLPTWVILVFALCAWFGEALALVERAPGTPILELDPGGHRGLIRDLLVTPDGHTLVSAGEDKTIRVWDIASRREVRKILGQIGPGLDGKIYAIALSPDGRWLAVGGYFQPDDVIRIYDFQSGALRRVLRSHKDVILDLAFSPDGRWLVSGSADHTAKVWDVQHDFGLQRTLLGHGAQVYAVDVLPDGRVVTAGYDNQILLWDVGRIQARYRNGHKLHYLAHNDDYVAATGAGDRKILIFDHDLNLQRTLISPTRPEGLAFSPNGRWLVAGAGAPPYTVILYDAHDGFKEAVRFKKHDNLVMALRFLDEETIASAGGDNNDIWIWNTQGEPRGHIAGMGRRVWAVGIDSKGLQWGNTLQTDPHQNANPLEQGFDLRALALVAEPKDTAARIRTRWRNYRVYHRPGGEHGYPDATLVIERDGRVVARITRNAANGLVHRTYGFSEGGLVLSGGAGGFLTAYNRMGREKARFVGHTGEIWSIASHGRWLLSGGSDQTLRLWDLKEVKAGKREIHPVLSLFVGRDGEWVAWTPEGYYAASPQGDRYVGFHINHGPDQAAEFLPASRFLASLYRPEVLRLAWKKGGRAIAAVVAQAGKHRSTAAPDTADLLPPRIRLRQPKGRQLSVRQDQVTIEFCVESQTREPITEIDILLNGRPLSDHGLERLPPGKMRVCRKRQVPLAAGQPRQTLTLLARNRYASTNPLVIDITRENAVAKIFKPDLYVLSIGVSDYRNDRLDLDLARADADAIAEAFENQRDLFNHIRVRRLLDGDATRDAILDGLDWILHETTQRDMAVIFIAGHGLNDEQGNYYFLPHDTDLRHLWRTAVGFDDFKGVVTSLPGKVLLLADTCHSGNIFGTKQRGSLARDITGAIKSILAAGTGQVIMTAATGNSASLEDPAWGHGAFTKALLEGLAGQANYDRNHTVTIKELDLYVTLRVKQLTEGLQKPTTIVPESLPDFPVAVVMQLEAAR